MPTFWAYLNHRREVLGATLGAARRCDGCERCLGGRSSRGLGVKRALVRRRLVAAPRLREDAAVRGEGEGRPAPAAPWLRDAGWVARECPGG